MDFLLRLSAVLFLIAITTACTTTRHEWGNYSTELYQYYKSPTQEQQQELQNELAKVFARAKSKGVAPAPGLYAEYGTFLLESGDSAQAIEYYQREKAAWPESAKLMDALIAALAQEPEEELSEESAHE